MQGASICVPAGVTFVETKVQKITAATAVGFPKDAEFSDSVPHVLKAALSSALDVKMGQYSSFQVSDPVDPSRRLHTNPPRRLANSGTKYAVHHVTYEIILDPSNKHLTTKAALDLVSPGTAPNQRMTDAVNAFSTKGNLSLWFKAVLPPTVFEDIVAVLADGSFMTVGVPPAVSHMNEPFGGHASALGEDDESKWWEIPLMVFLAVICCCCLWIFLFICCRRCRGEENGLQRGPQVCEEAPAERDAFAPAPVPEAIVPVAPAVVPVPEDIIDTSVPEDIIDTSVDIPDKPKIVKPTNFNVDTDILPVVTLDMSVHKREHTYVYL